MDRMHIHKRAGLRGALAAALLLAVAALATPAPAAAASRYEAVTATVPVEVVVKGDKPSKQLTSTFVMTPADGEEVLPKEDAVSVAGEGKAAFELSYDEVGEHNYTVTQTTRDADRWTIDRTVYEVTAYCMWDEETDTLFTKVIMKDSDGYKDENCLFENAYEAPASPGRPGGLPSTGDAALLPVAVACVAGAVVLGAGAVAYRKRHSN